MHKLLHTSKAYNILQLRMKSDGPSPSILPQAEVSPESACFPTFSSSLPYSEFTGMLAIISNKCFGLVDKYQTGFAANTTESVGRVVGIATGYGLDDSGIESRRGRDFSHLCRPALWATQPYVQWVPGLSQGVKSGRGVTLTPHPLLVPRSWKSKAIPLLPLWAVRPVQSLSACTRVHFTLTFLQQKANIGKSAALSFLNIKFQVFALLGCYAALIGSYRRFGGSLSVPPSRANKSEKNLLGQLDP
jgi:hypothetical protein